MNQKLIDILLGTEGDAVDINQFVGVGSERTILSESKYADMNDTNAININLDDFFINEGRVELAIRNDNMDRLIRDGWLNASVGGVSVSSLNESVVLNNDLELLNENYQAIGDKETRQNHFNYELDDDNVKHLSSGADAKYNEKSGNYEYTDDSGTAHKISKKQTLKLSKGNVKVGGNTVIINMSSATDCVAGMIGMCEYYDSGECYALGAEQLRHTVLRAKRLQGVQWRNFDGKKIGFGVLMIIASLPNWDKIGYVRLNESGDFADKPTDNAMSVANTTDLERVKIQKAKFGKLSKTAKKDKEYTDIVLTAEEEKSIKSSGKQRSDMIKKMVTSDSTHGSDIDKIDQLLTTIKEVASKGEKAFTTYFSDISENNKDFKALVSRAVEVAKSSRAKKLLDKSVKVPKLLGIYTYSHRSDLTNKFKSLVSKHKHFCMNASTDMHLSNSFRGVDFVTFKSIFGREVERRRDNEFVVEKVYGAVYSNKDTSSLPKKVQEYIKDIGTAIKSDNAEVGTDRLTNRFIKACMEDCSICDFCKYPSDSLILIPIHGSGSSVANYQKKLGVAVRNNIDTLMVYHINNLGSVEHAIELYHEESDKAKKEIIWSQISKAIKDSNFEKNLESVKLDDDGITAQDVHRLLHFGKNRFGFIIGEIIKEMTGVKISHAIEEVFHDLQILHKFSELRSQADVQTNKQVITTTVRYLHPNSANLNLLDKISRTARKHMEGMYDKVESLSRKSSNDEYTITEDSLKSNAKNIVSSFDEAIAKIDSALKTQASIDAKLEKAKQHTDGGKKPTKAMKLTDTQARVQMNSYEVRELEAYRIGLISQKANIKKVIDGISKIEVPKMDKMKSELATFKEGFIAIQEHIIESGQEVEMPIVQRMLDFIENSMKSNNEGTVKIYYGIVSEFYDHLGDMFEEFEKIKEDYDSENEAHKHFKSTKGKRKRKVSSNFKAKTEKSVAGFGGDEESDDEETISEGFLDVISKVERLL